MPTIVNDWRTLSRALSSSIDPRLKQLLADRVRQLDVEGLSTAARFVIVQPGDTIADADQALGFCILQNLADGKPQRSRAPRGDAHSRPSQGA